MDADALWDLARRAGREATPEAAARILASGLPAAALVDGLRAQVAGSMAQSAPGGLWLGLDRDGRLGIDVRRADGAPLTAAVIAGLRRMAADVAERVADRALFAQVEAAKRGWEAAVDGLPLGVLRVATDGRVRRGNRAIAGWLGLDVRTLAGRRCCDLLPHHDAQGCPVQAQATGPRDARWGTAAAQVVEETAYALPGGDRVLVLVDVTQTRADAAARDALLAETAAARAAAETALARLHAAQARLVQAEKAATLAHLAAGLAHGINNPLAWLRGDLEALAGLRQNALAQAPADALETLGGIIEDGREGTARIARIIEAISTLALEPEPSPVSLSPLLADAVAHARVRRPGATFEFAAPAGPERVIAGHPRALQEAVGHLLDNAADHGTVGDTAGESHGSGPITLAFEVASDGTVTITVGDHGPGPSDDALARALEPFWPQHPAGTHLGLGLTVAAAVAARHGGTASLERRPVGGGALQRLTLRPA